MDKVRVLIVDDSPTARSLLRAILERSENIFVCGEAEDAYAARSAIKCLRPDVITLAVVMPKMDGIAFLRNLMRLHPIPTVMISSEVGHGSPLAIEALALGAVDCIHKPTAESLASTGNEIVNKVINAAQTNIEGIRIDSLAPAAQLSTAEACNQYIKNRVIAIGASTGGVPAIEKIISKLPMNSPPIVIVQHIPALFLSNFAIRLNNAFDINIVEAHDGQVIKPGSVYLAPGDFHLALVKYGCQTVCRLNQRERVNYHRPAVDVLFDSIAKISNGNASAALLTGMGDDGAKGLLHMKNAGCFTMIQDKNSSAVWGMPGSAHALGAAQEVAPLNRIGQRLLYSCRIEGANDEH